MMSILTEAEALGATRTIDPGRKATLGFAVFLPIPILLLVQYGPKVKDLRVFHHGFKQSIALVMVVEFLALASVFMRYGSKWNTPNDWMTRAVMCFVRLFWALTLPKVAISSLTSPFPPRSPSGFLA